MREIKFRAWDKRKMMIIPPFSIGLLFSNYCNEWNYQATAGTPLFEAVRDDWDIELMQYTGLKDKGGAEIYEGDILENVKGHRFVMEYGGLAFGWRGLTPYANGMVKFSYDTITNPNITELTELEVIGNIYENKELLNE